MEPKLLSKEFNYYTECPECKDEECILTVWAHTSEPNRIHYSIECKKCGYKDGWTVEKTNEKGSDGK
jgi:Zn ribbon nucleic-acid-binding protein